MPPGVHPRDGGNATPYLTPAPATTTNLVTQTVQNSATTYTTIVDIASIPDPNAPSGSHLTAGQIAGIAIGAVAFLLLLGLICYCLPRRRSSKDYSDTSSDPDFKGPRPSTGIRRAATLRPDRPEVVGVEYAALRTTGGRSVPRELRNVEIIEVVADRRGKASGWRRPRRGRHHDDNSIDTGSQIDADSTSDVEIIVEESIRRPQRAQVRSQVFGVEEIRPRR